MPSITPRLLLSLWRRSFQDPGAEDRWQRGRGNAGHDRWSAHHGQCSLGVLFPLQTFNLVRPPGQGAGWWWPLPSCLFPPPPPGAVQPKKKGFAKKRGQCCETCDAPPSQGQPCSAPGSWPVDPSSSQPGRAYRVRVTGLAVPSVRWDSRVMGSWRAAPEAWEVGHLCSSRPPPLSYFSMLGRGVLPGIANPAARHEKTVYRPEVPSSRSPASVTRG